MFIKPRRRLLAAAVVPLVLVLAACAPHAGTVHDKHYSAAYSSVVCHLSGKVTVCTPTYYPARWTLDLYADNGKHGWRSVSERAYDSVSVGDYYDDKAAIK